MYQNNVIHLTETELGHLAQIAETSLRVFNRHQFFVWTQGTLQRLLPHEILVCGVDSGARHGFEYYHFASTPQFRDGHFEALTRPEGGLLDLLIEQAGRGGAVILCDADVHDSGADAAPRAANASRMALSDGGDAHEPAGTSSSDAPESASDAAWLAPAASAGLRALVEANGLHNLAAQLWIGARNNPQAFYAFARLARPLDARTAHFIKLIVPHLHVTFLRVLSVEDTAASRVAPRSSQLVTQRQQEILQLIRDGKTNAEIATILQVSPWTVKNHVQTIFQRLNTNNRTQTIMRAISLGILGLN